MLQRAASNAYSWWWASHIRTKQSKWLDNNLRDMEDRVKCILVLLGEEADSFSKRAEMYYKRRPEVIGSVEEAYRSYRALAERYDHISGELHKANHTIATTFPDQVQYAMLEEDDNNLPKAFTTVDPRRIHKSTVDELMKKKEKGGKSGLKNRHENYATTINKENAQAEISRLQKEILVLQTEKEFIKSSYEAGIAKYWDLEKEINDMQEKICYFQEEFDESAMIEDDEARALMTATALQSCEETIIKLQEQQKISFSQMMVESERVKASREKLKDIMRGYGKTLSDCTNSPKKNERKDAAVKIYEVYHMKQEKIELQAIVDKIKEFFQEDSGISVVEIAEKVDEVVNKVVDLKLMLSSQTAQIDRLCLENTELEKTLQELEEENTVLTSGLDGFNDKLKQAEEELIGVQNIESSIQEEKSTVYSNFSETTSSFCDITYMLQSPSLIEHQTAGVPMHMLIDEATSSADTEASSKHEKAKTEEGSQMNEATRKPGIDGFPDCSDDTEDLCCSGHQDESSFAGALVDKETAQNADHDTFGEHKKEAEDVHEIVSNATRSPQPYFVHSHEIGILEQLHHTSSNGPADHNEKVKQVDSKQDSSKADHTIPEGHSEQDMDQAEDSYTTENSTITSEQIRGVEDQEENMVKLHQLLMSGLQDKEKVLLTEYTSILRNYKNAKRKITELEIKNQECLNEITAKISELLCANAMKDKEIQSLRELLNSSADKNRLHIIHQMNPNMSLSLKSETFRGHRRTPSFLPVQQRKQSLSSISRMIVKNYSLKHNQSLKSLKEGDMSHGVDTDLESLNLEDIKMIDAVRMEDASPFEEKFRRDIDVLLEENLEFWMKFSTSFQQIQEFQRKYEQLQSEIGKIINEDKLNPNNVHANDTPAKAESEATEKRLREFKIELQVWLEQNAMFKGELQCRFASLCSIQEEINGALEIDEDTEEGARFTSYQAAKFQGEVLNMKQENNKVADELQAGLDHVKGLQAEMEKVLAKMIKSSSLSGPKGSSSWRNAPSKSRIPLRLFLFPTKKKKPSLFACVNPALQKQQSDMAFFTTMK